MRRTRVVAVVTAVLLSAAAVTIAGPIGFVGLVAPVLVRVIAPVVPGLLRHRVLIPAAGLSGIVILLGSDVLLRLILGGQAGVEIPAGILTMFTGGDRAGLGGPPAGYRRSGPQTAVGGRRTA